MASFFDKYPLLHCVSSEMSLSEISSLQKTLNSAIDAFKAELIAQNLPEPSLNTSKRHPIDEITYIPTPVMYEARRVAVASLVRSIRFLLHGHLMTSDATVIGTSQISYSISVRCTCREYVHGHRRRQCSTCW